MRDRLALLVADGLEIGDHATEALDLGVPVVLAAVELLLQDRDAHRLVGDLLQGGPVLEALEDHAADAQAHEQPGHELQPGPDDHAAVAVARAKIELAFLDKSRERHVRLALLNAPHSRDSA